MKQAHRYIQSGDVCLFSADYHFQIIYKWHCIGFLNMNKKHIHPARKSGFYSNWMRHKYEKKGNKSLSYKITLNLKSLKRQIPNCVWKWLTLFLTAALYFIVTLLPLIVCYVCIHVSCWHVILKNSREREERGAACVPPKKQRSLSGDPLCTCSAE